MDVSTYGEHPASSGLMEMQSALVNGQPGEVGLNKRDLERSDSFPWDDDNCNSIGDEAPGDGAARPAEMFLQEGMGVAHNSGQGSVGGENVRDGVGGGEHFLLGYQPGPADGSHGPGPVPVGKHSEYASLDDVHKGNLFRCDVCQEAFHASGALKEHMVHMGHFKCSMPECSSQIFTTSDELMAHQVTVHAGPQFVQNPQLYDGNTFQHEQPYMPQPEQFQNFQQQQTLPAADNFLQQTQHLGQQISIQPRSFNNVEQHSQFGDQTSQHSLSNLSLQQHNTTATPQYGNNGTSQSQHSSDFTQYSDNSNPPSSQSMPPIQTRPFSNVSQASPSSSPSNSVSSHPQIQLRPFSNLVQQPQVSPVTAPQVSAVTTPQIPGITITPQKRPLTGDGPDTPTKKLVTELVLGSGQETIAQTLSKLGQGQDPRPPAEKSNASSVANMLATRGITVTPSGGQQRQPQQQQQQQQPPTPKLSSLSITPSQGAGGSFPVPQGRGLVSRQQQQQRAVQRPDRPPTVDLTREASPPRQLQPPQHQPRQMPPQMQPQMQPQMMQQGRLRGRAKPAGMGRFTCQICFKVFSSMETLNNHMNLHRSPGKPPYRCTNCPAQYSSHHGLLIHQQACLRNLAPPPVKARQAVPRLPAPARQPSASVAGQAPIIGQQQAGDYGLVVVDMRNPATLNRLRSLGVTSYLPFPSAGNVHGIPLINANRPGNVGYLGVTHMILMGASMPLPR